MHHVFLRFPYVDVFLAHVLEPGHILLGNHLSLAEGPVFYTARYNPGHIISKRQANCFFYRYLAHLSPPILPSRS